MATILAVDDAMSIRIMVKTLLEQDGHQITLATDGAEGLELARNADFDLIITDINMPNVDGISLITELRNLAHMKYTPILVMTTEGSDEKKAQAKTAGATGWIQKPIKLGQINRSVNKVVVAA